MVRQSGHGWIRGSEGGLADAGAASRTVGTGFSLGLVYLDECCSLECGTSAIQ
jgi:hypothetical protein